MRQDFELMRQILLRLEAMEKPTGSIWLVNPGEPPLDIEDFSADAVAYHLTQLVLRGYIDVQELFRSGSIVFRQLTPAGHDWIDSVRDAAIWRKTKEVLKSTPTVTFDIVKDLGISLLKTHLGL